MTPKAKTRVPTLTDRRYERATATASVFEMQWRSPILSTLATLLVAGVVACGETRPPAEGASGSTPSPPSFVQVDGFRSLDPPAADGALAPQLTAGPGGIVLSWLEATTDGNVLRFARLASGEAGSSWSEARDVVSGADFFANWADVPSVVAVTPDELLAHWLEKNGDSTYAYGIRIVRSTDGGETWDDLGWLHDDGTPTEHGFVSWAFDESTQEVRVFWLDGREMVGSHGEGGGAMAVRTASLSGGQIGPSEVLDARTCECCQTEAARTAEGFLVAYRDRSEEEIRDIVAVRSTAQGWQAPQLVAEDGWRIPACPVNGPAVDAQGQRAVIAWFTAADQRPRVRLAFSNDSGASFGTPLEVAPTIDGQRPTGRVDVALTPDGGALVSWLTEGDERAGVALTYFDATGRRGLTTLLGETSMARASGVPRMLLAEPGSVLVTWRETGETAHLRAALVSVAELSGLAL